MKSFVCFIHGASLSIFFAILLNLTEESFKHIFFQMYFNLKKEVTVLELCLI